MRIATRALNAAAAVVTVVVMLATPVRGQEDPITRASRMIQAGEYDDAIELLETYTARNPDDGLAWATLANAHHLKRDYETAARINRHAASFPGVRPTALYNEACAFSLLGRVDDAHRSLGEALAEGFLDFDLLATDPDLEALRANYDIALPAEHEYTDFEGKNGVRLAYRVLLPRDHDPGKAYPAVVVFPPGDGSRTADWTIETLIGDGAESHEWIVIVVVAPGEGWFTHPAHHALNDLLDRLQDDYQVEGGSFHVAGFGAGARVATTYARMSAEYFHTLTTFSAWHWRGWLDQNLGRAFADTPVRLVVGNEDEFGLPLNRAIYDEMSAADVDVEIRVRDGENQLLSGMRDGAFLSYIPRAAILLKTTW